jgi:methyl-accepting chemotaxis protein
MKRVLTRLLGLALIIAAIGGLILSILGLIVVAQVKGQVEATVNQQLDLVDRLLGTTSDGLAVAETSLAQVVGTVQTLESAMAGVGKTIDDTIPMIDSVAELLGEQLPATIKTTQETLTWLGDSAHVIDDIMTVITAIPLLGLNAYNPEMPLQQGFERVADSLDGIPKSLGVAQQGLLSTGDNMDQVEAELTTIAGDVGQLATSLENAQSLVVEYQGIVADLQEMVSSLRASLPGWLRALRWGLSLVLIWLGVVQLGLLTQGWELIGRSRSPEGSDRR